MIEANASASDTRNRVAAAAWIAAVPLALLLAVTLAEIPIALAALAAVLVAGVVLVVAFAQPRWILVFQLFLLVGYVPDVVGERLGLPLASQLLVVLVAGSVFARWVLGVEAFGAHVLAAVFPLVALVVIKAVSAVVAPIAPPGVLDLVDRLRLKEATLVVLIVLIIDRTEWLRRALWAFALAAGGLAILAVVQQATGSADVGYGGFAAIEVDTTLRRSAGPLDPNFFGQVLVAATVVYLYLRAAAERAGTRLVALALTVVCVITIFLTYSRASLIALAAALLIAGVLRRVRVLPAAAGVVAAVVLAVQFLPEDAKARLGVVGVPGLGGAASATDSSVQGRVSENTAAIMMFRDNPTLGVGAGNYPANYLEYSQTIGLDPRPEARAAHNLFLEVLAETGVLGAVAFLIVVGLAIVGAWMARRELDGSNALLGEGVFVALVGFLINGFFLHEGYPRYLWIIIALALAAWVIARHQPRTVTA